MNRNRWLVASLVVSLVLNIALVGFVFGRISWIRAGHALMGT